MINKKRLAYTRRVRRALDFEGVHVHYSTDNTLALGRNGRRNVLRYVESFVGAGSRNEAGRSLEELAVEFPSEKKNVTKIVFFTYM